MLQAIRVLKNYTCAFIIYVARCALITNFLEEQSLELKRNSCVFSQIFNFLDTTLLGFHCFITSTFNVSASGNVTKQKSYLYFLKHLSPLTMINTSTNNCTEGLAVPVSITVWGQTVGRGILPCSFKWKWQFLE